MIARDRRLLARRGTLLITLYVVAYGLPRIIWDVDVGGWFFATLLSSFFLGCVAFTRGSSTFQFYYIYFVFVMIPGYFVQFISGIHYIHSIHYIISPSRVDSTTFVVISLHFAGLIGGAALRRGTPRAPIVRARLPGEFWIFGAFVFCFFLGVFVSIVGAGPLLNVRNDLLQAEISGTVHVLSLVLKASPFVYLAFLSGRLRGGRMRINDMIVAAVIFFAAVAFANPANTPRFISLTGILLVVAAWLGKTSKSKHLLAVTVISAFSAVILLPVTSMMRRGFGHFDLSALPTMYSGLEFASIQMLIDGIKYSSSLPNGNVILTGLFALVPPNLYPQAWRSAAIGPSIAAGSGYVFDNAAVPSFIAGYLDGGIVGLVLFSILMGYVMQLASIAKQTDMRNRRDGYALLLFACTPILARGDFRTAMSAIYEFIVAYEVFLFASRMRISNSKEVPRGGEVGLASSSDGKRFDLAHPEALPPH